jgi:hypothetical protein
VRIPYSVFRVEHHVFWDMEITVAGEVVRLLPERASLLAAPTHVVRRRPARRQGGGLPRGNGLAVPEGHLADDLSRLSQDSSRGSARSA